MNWLFYLSKEAIPSPVRIHTHTSTCFLNAQKVNTSRPVKTQYSGSLESKNCLLDFAVIWLGFGGANNWNGYTIHRKAAFQIIAIQYGNHVIIEHLKCG